MNAVTSRIKILGRMNVAEKRKPQDGRLKRAIPADRNRTTFIHLANRVWRKIGDAYFDPDVLVRGFKDLGLVGDDFEKMAKNGTRA